MNFEIAPKSTETLLNWHDAKLYCFSLNIDGKTGWRLPTREELDEICNSHNDFEKWYYWSSTEFGGDSFWTQNFANGYQYNFSKYDDIYVRAIRSTD